MQLIRNCTRMPCNYCLITCCNVQFLFWWASYYQFSFICPSLDQSRIKNQCDFQSYFLYRGPKVQAMLFQISVMPIFYSNNIMVSEFAKIHRFKMSQTFICTNWTNCIQIIRRMPFSEYFAVLLADLQISASPPMKLRSGYSL